MNAVLPDPVQKGSPQMLCKLRVEESLFLSPHKPALCIVAREYAEDNHASDWKHEAIQDLTTAVTAQNEFVPAVFSSSLTLQLRLIIGIKGLQGSPQITAPFCVVSLPLMKGEELNHCY